MDLLRKRIKQITFYKAVFQDGFLFAVKLAPEIIKKLQEKFSQKRRNKESAKTRTVQKNSRCVFLHIVCYNLLST